MIRIVTFTNNEINKMSDLSKKNKKKIA